ncbi:MAG: histidine kinase [Nocardiopsaceae bacterium]|nr:histidine kinase [Nocardiopsaceae bacterium]
MGTRTGTGPEAARPTDSGRAGAREQRPAGADASPPNAFRIGVSGFALATLGAGAAAAVLPAGAAAEPAGLLLVAAAGLPWALWALGDDGKGPSWWFAALALVPIAAAGLGQGSVFSLGSGGLAYPLVTCPLLLLVLLYAAFAPTRMAAGVAAAAFGAFTAALLVGWSGERPAVSVSGAAVWSAGFGFCLAAGYAIRFSHAASRRLAEAREAQAWRAAAEQRRRVAQDVHDVVAHTLAITLLHITAARMAVGRSSPEEAEEALEEAERHGRASLADIRRMVRLLRSEDAGAAPAVDTAHPGLADIESLVESYRAAGVDVRLSLPGDTPHASPAGELAVYRVLQEALANAIRHGGDPVVVRLQADGAALSLAVDNPVRPGAERSASGSGLLGMRERVRAAGGTIEAGLHGDRWMVHVRIPGEEHP